MFCRSLIAVVYVCGKLLWNAPEIRAQEGAISSIHTQRFWISEAVGASSNLRLNLSQGLWYSPGPFLIGVKYSRSPVRDDSWRETAVLGGVIERVGNLALSVTGGRSTAHAIQSVRSDQSALVDTLSSNGLAYSIVASGHLGIIGAGVEVFGNATSERTTRRGVAFVVQLGILDSRIHF